MKSYVYEIVYDIIYIWKISINHLWFHRVPRIRGPESEPPRRVLNACKCWVIVRVWPVVLAGTEQSFISTASESDGGRSANGCAVDLTICAVDSNTCLSSWWCSSPARTRIRTYVELSSASDLGRHCCRQQSFISAASAEGRSAKGICFHLRALFSLAYKGALRPPSDSVGGGACKGMLPATARVRDRLRLWSLFNKAIVRETSESSCRTSWSCH